MFFAFSYGPTFALGRKPRGVRTRRLRAGAANGRRHALPSTPMTSIRAPPVRHLASKAHARGNLSLHSGWPSDNSSSAHTCSIRTTTAPQWRTNASATCADTLATTCDGRRSGRRPVATALQPRPWRPAADVEPSADGVVVHGLASGSLAPCAFPPPSGSKAPQICRSPEHGCAQPSYGRSTTRCLRAGSVRRPNGLLSRTASRGRVAANRSRRRGSR